MTDVAPREHLDLAGRFKETMATYRQAEDLINIGAYKAGSNRGIDYALKHYDGMVAYLKQAVQDPVSMADAVQGLKRLFDA